MRAFSLILITLIVSIKVYGQSFLLTDTAAHQMALCCYTVNIAANDPNGDLKLFFVQNISSATKKTRVRKNILSATTGHNIGFSFGSVMYGPNTNYGIGESMIAGQIFPDNTGKSGLMPYFDPNGFAGTSIVRYTVYDSLNHGDSVSVTITYNAISTGVKENTEENIPEAYPNPASNTVYFLPGNFTNATITLFTAGGKNIKTKELDSLGKNEIDVSRLEEGIYFYTISENGKIIRTKKLVIIK